MVITDCYDHTLDEKGRMAIPSHIRAAMDPVQDGTAFYVVPEEHFLYLIPDKLFHRLAEKETAGLTVDEDIAKARRYLFSRSPLLVPDKSGRVIIPDRFRASSKNRSANMEGQVALGDEVTLAGVGDRMELWNRNQYYEHIRTLTLERKLAAEKKAKAAKAAAEAAAAPVPAATPEAVPAAKPNPV